MVAEVADVVIVKDNKVLLVQQRKEVAKGLWSYPGGGVENGETLEDAVIREVKEELGVDLTAPILFKTYNITTPRGPLEINTFIGSIGNQTISLKEDELIAYGWFTLKELENKTDLRSDLVLKQAQDVLIS